MRRVLWQWKGRLHLPFQFGKDNLACSILRLPLWGSVKYQKEKTQRGKGACKSLDWNVLKKRLLPGWACGRNPRLLVYFSLLVEDTELFSSFRFLSFSCLAGQQEQMPYCVPPCPQSMRSWRESWGGAGTHVVLPTMNLQ